jgi:hypothetical protein
MYICWCPREPSKYLQFYIKKMVELDILRRCREDDYPCHMSGIQYIVVGEMNYKNPFLIYVQY